MNKKLLEEILSRREKYVHFYKKFKPEDVRKHPLAIDTRIYNMMSIAKVYCKNKKDKEWLKKLSEEYTFDTLMNVWSVEKVKKVYNRLFAIVLKTGYLKPERKERNE